MEVVQVTVIMHAGVIDLMNLLDLEVVVVEEEDLVVHLDSNPFVLDINLGDDLPVQHMNLTAIKKGLKIII